MIEKEVPVGTFDNMVLGPNGALYEKERMTVAEEAVGFLLLVLATGIFVVFLLILSV